ncbi:MAG: DNA glycosylase [Chthoniobacterales bacterium]
MIIPAPDFDLALTLDSGQTFHWEPSGAGYLGTIGDRAVYVKQREGAMEIRGVPAEVATQYFALDHPLAEICASFPDDSAMQSAAEFCRGLRIIRQPHWECLASFITSSMKQVAHIRQISHTLRQRFGDEKSLDGQTVHVYPPPKRVAALQEKDLRACALGYRAKNLLAAAQLISSGEVDLDTLSKLPDDELRSQLCELPGVGAKVANCVMLFAYERLRAFPIDVWVERVLMQKYFPRRRRMTAGKLRDFAAKHFGAHGGYAQQYLFHHARKTTPRRLSPRAS